MNRTEVRPALNAVLNPKSELYKETLRKRRDLPPDQARQWIAMDLATPVAALLSGQPEYHLCPNMMLQSGIGTRVTFRPDRAAQLLVLNAMKSDVDSAISWLADLLENARIGTARSAALAAHGRDGDDTDQTHRTDPVFIVAALTL
jgi:hypothetical protein